MSGKIKCKSCKEPFSPSTLKKNGGICGRCFTKESTSGNLRECKGCKKVFSNKVLDEWGWCESCTSKEAKTGVCSNCSKKKSLATLNKGGGVCRDCKKKQKEEKKERKEKQHRVKKAAPKKTSKHKEDSDDSGSGSGSESDSDDEFTPYDYVFTKGKRKNRACGAHALPGE